MIRSGSVEQVSQVLDANPEAMEDAFFDHRFEPALCSAVRAGCNLDIINLLLRYDADANATDKRGFSALTALCSLPHGGAERPADGAFLLLPPGWGAPAVHAHANAQMLAAARALELGGVVLSEPDGDGRVPAQVAQDYGHRALSLFCGYSREARACIVLSRTPRVCGLPLHVVQAVQGYLMPPDALRRLLPRDRGVAGVH